MGKAKITIEKKIKLPERRESKYPFAEMEKGDSIEIGEYTVDRAKSIWGSICNFKKKEKNKNKVFSCRKTTDGKLRVWRTA